MSFYFCFLCFYKYYNINKSQGIINQEICIHFPCYLICPFSFSNSRHLLCFCPPDNDYYLGYLLSNTGFEPRGKVTIINKETTVPDFHGHEISCAIIKLDTTDYKDLYRIIKNDVKFNDQEYYFTDTDLIEMTFTNVTKKEHINYVYEACKFTPPHNHFYFIGFADDKQTVVSYFSNMWAPERKTNVDTIRK